MNEALDELLLTPPPQNQPLPSTPITASSSRCSSPAPTTEATNEALDEVLMAVQEKLRESESKMAELLGFLAEGEEEDDNDNSYYSSPPRSTSSLPEAR